MEQQTGSTLRKEDSKTVYCHPAYLTFMQSTSCETLGGWNIAGFKMSGRNINNLRYANDHSNGRNQRGTREPLDKGDRGEWKGWLNTQHSKY